jgi:hypothetical protein
MGRIRFGLFCVLAVGAGALLAACAGRATSPAPTPEPVVKATGTPVYVDASRAAKPARATADAFGGWALERRERRCS